MSLTNHADQSVKLTYPLTKYQKAYIVSTTFSNTPKLVSMIKKDRACAIGVCLPVEIWSS